MASVPAPEPDPSDQPRPQIASLRISDPPERWEALGFSVQDSRLALGGVEIELGQSEGQGITGWTLAGLEDGPPQVDGLPTASRGDQPTLDGVPEHENGAIGVDQVVVLTPDFDRTAAALEQAGIPLRRIRDGGGFRQGFRRLGPAILELVEAAGAPDGPARFWGLVVIVPALEPLRDQLGSHLGEIRDAVQSGRQIASLRRSAGLSPRVAFMTPE
jgi:hypothetical protein